MDHRGQLIDHLEQARGMIRAYFEAPDCDWERRFHDDQPVCQSCGDTHVCQWLFEQDPAPDLSTYSQERIRSALQFAVGYLDGRMIEAGHIPMRCHCATCKWVRDAYSLLQRT